MRNVISAFAVLALVATGSVFAETATAVTGKYNNNCALGMTTGKEVKTNCEINWTDTATKETFCFGNEQARTDWSKDTANNEKLANTHWEKLSAEHHADAATGHKAS